jgi:hypothetical protein
MNILALPVSKQEATRCQKECLCFFLYMKHLCLPQKMTNVEGEIQYLIVYLFLMRLFKSIPWEYSFKKIQQILVPLSNEIGFFQKPTNNLQTGTFCQKKPL